MTKFQKNRQVKQKLSVANLLPEPPGPPGAGDPGRERDPGSGIKSNRNPNPRTLTLTLTLTLTHEP